jgi:K+-sensing histidine kinase KdpD
MFLFECYLFFIIIEGNIHKNIQSNISKLINNEEEAETFLNSFDKFMNSNTEEEVNKNWEDFINLRKENDPVVTYIQKNWYDLRQHFVKVSFILTSLIILFS